LNGNYALFLETIRNEYDQAESYYLMMLIGMEAMPAFYILFVKSMIKQKSIIKKP